FGESILGLVMNPSRDPNDGSLDMVCVHGVELFNDRLSKIMLL
ncbi:hypothetical protein Tco_1100911, partial [Tanacetum coccineum]